MFEDPIENEILRLKGFIPELNFEIKNKIKISSVTHTKTHSNSHAQVDILGQTRPPANNGDDLQGVSAANWTHDIEEKVQLLYHRAENETVILQFAEHILCGESVKHSTKKFKT